jgi:hypothetical protein
MALALESTDIKNKLEDLSGVALKPGENPYNALIETCNDDPVRSSEELLSATIMSIMPQLLPPLPYKHARTWNSNGLPGANPSFVRCSPPQA